MLVVIGCVLVLNPELLVNQVHLGTAPTFGNFLLGIAVGMVAYTGIETISNMSEEARSPNRSIPRGTAAVVLAVVGIYAFLPSIALSAMPVTQDAAGHFTTELGTTFADDPVLGIVENLGLSSGLTDVLRVYVGVLAGVILLIATNAGPDRPLAADVLDGPAPPAAGDPARDPSRGSRRRTWRSSSSPLVAIVVMAPGKTQFLGTIYAFGATLSFTVAHVSRDPPAKTAGPSIPSAVRERRVSPCGVRPAASRSRGVEVPMTRGDRRHWAPSAPSWSRWCSTRSCLPRAVAG